MTVWKSDNQEVKEETFIQTGRRSGDEQPGQKGLAARWQVEDQGRQQLAEWAVQHLRVDKLGGTIEAETDRATQCSIVGK